MASSGTISGSTNYSAGGSMVVLFVRALWLQTPDAANNRSTVRVEFQARQSRGVYFEDPATWVVKIDGAAVAAPAGSLKARQDGSWTTCWVKEYTVAHNEQGQKTLTLSMEGAYQIGSWSDTARCPGSGAATITLDPIEAGGGGDTPAAAAISSVTSRLMLDGQHSMTIQIAKPSGTLYCAAVVSIGTVASDPIPMDGATDSATYTPPASWADQIPDSAERTDGIVRLTTYSDAAHTTPVGSAVGHWTGYGLISIAFLSSPVQLGGRLSLTLRRPGAAQYAAVAVTIGSMTYTHSLDGAQSSSILIPEEWGAQFPAAKSATATVQAITYDSMAHNHQVGSVPGSFVCEAPASLGPQLAGGFIWIEGGTFYGSGADAGARAPMASRLRTGQVTLSAGSYWATNTANLMMRTFVYDDNGAYLPAESASSWSEVGQTSFDLTARRRVALIFRRSDDSALSPDVNVGLHIEGQTTGGELVVVTDSAHGYPSSSNAVVSGWGVGVETYSAVGVKLHEDGVYTYGGASVARVELVYNGAVAAQMVKASGWWAGSSPVIQDAGRADISVRVYDTRGYMTSGTVPAVIEDYIAPRLGNVSVFRADSVGEASEDGGYISVKATASVSSVLGLNSGTLRARYKSASSSWSAWTTLTSGTATLLGGGQLLPETAYAVQIEVTDATGATATYQDTVPSKAAMLHLLAGNLGLGLGKYSQKGSGWMDMAFSLHTDHDVEVGRNLLFTAPANIPYPALGGEGIEITSGTDLDTLTDIGNYYCASSSTVTSLINKPASLDTAFVMRVYGGAGPNLHNFVVQEITAWLYGQMWRRHIIIPQGPGSWFKYNTTAD